MNNFLIKYLWVYIPTPFYLCHLICIDDINKMDASYLRNEE